MPNTPNHYSVEDWSDDLLMLATKFSSLGVEDDIATMQEDERWGVYCYLLTKLGEE